MPDTQHLASDIPVVHGLKSLGLHDIGRVYANQATPVLYEEVIRRNEGVIAADGPLVVLTGHHIGRSSNDKS